MPGVTSAPTTPRPSRDPPTIKRYITRSTTSSLPQNAKDQNAHHLPEITTCPAAPSCTPITTLSPPWMSSSPHPRDLTPTNGTNNSERDTPVQLLENLTTAVQDVTLVQELVVSTHNMLNTRFRSTGRRVGLSIDEITCCLRHLKKPMSRVIPFLMIRKRLFFTRLEPYAKQ